MPQSRKMSLALGTITRDFNDPRPSLRFLRNAQRHGHKVDRLIVAYSHSLDLRTIEAVRGHVRLELVHAGADDQLRKQLRELGLSGEQARGVLGAGKDPPAPEIPYCAYRNAVLIKALLLGMDHLLFFDDDTRPRLLGGMDRGTPRWLQADFAGAHLAHLSEPETTATSSDYSGYYIIPPMRFDGLEELLIGLGKEASVDYLLDCLAHGCLNLGSSRRKPAEPTGKLLGGNLGLSLDKPWQLQPFFSTLYSFEGSWILGRGEDTLLGQAISGTDGIALDIQLPIFHDTFGEFPTRPDMKRKRVRDRFYRACLGWLGRNPFLLWYLGQLGITGVDFELQLERQRAKLAIGAPRAAAQFDDPRFARLPGAFDASLANLDCSRGHHAALMDAWGMLVKCLAPDRVDEPALEENSDLALAS